LLQALAGRARPEEAVERLAGNFLSRLAALPGPYFGGDDEQQVGLETVLERAPGAICRVVREPDGRVALHYPGNRIDGPTRIAAALDFIARTPRFAVGQLPDGLTPDSKLVLARRLVREKFLTIVEAEGSENP
jgi:hypothetical protein